MSKVQPPNFIGFSNQASRTNDDVSQMYQLPNLRKIKGKGKGKEGEEEVRYSMYLEMDTKRTKRVRKRGIAGR